MSSHNQTKQSPSPEDIEEAETTLWLGQQLDRIRGYLSEHGADDDMLIAVDYLLEENDRWLDPQIADDLRAGRLPSGGTQATPLRRADRDFSMREKSENSS
jgi:hypothetical protein